MLIDSIIGRLKRTRHEADEFLDKLQINTRKGTILVRWQWEIAVAWDELLLLRTNSPDRFVLCGLQEIITKSHREMQILARAMGVPDATLHPRRKPEPWFCKMCHCEVNDETITEHAVYRHNMADTVSG